MNAKVLVAGLVAACSLMAQPPGGPRGRGPMGAGGPGGPGRGGQGPVETVAGAPYSAVEVRTSQQVLATGGFILRTEQTNVSRDSQGRVRRETTRKGPDGQSETRVTISDPVAGMVYELDATNKTATSRPARFPSQSQTASTSGSRSQMMGAGRRAPAQTETNVKRETLAARSMNGMLASGARVTHTIPAGTIGNSQAIETVRETWIADDLKVPLMTRMADPRTGTTTMELTNVNRSQPDPSLFQIPSDYTVKKAMGGPMGGPMGGRGPGGRGPGPARKQ